MCEFSGSSTYHKKSRMDFLRKETGNEWSFWKVFGFRGRIERGSF